MHESARRALAKFYFDYRDALDRVQVADMGALNINGAAKDVIPHCTGFDIVAGPGVDVVITPGNIPEMHRCRYGAALSLNSFTFCPDPSMYKQQLVDLLVEEGLLFMTMCSEKCAVKHTTSNNPYGFGDEFRVKRDELERFFAIEFDILEFCEQNYGHPEYVLLARLRCRPTSAG
jgi:hypothetical protein